MDGMKMDRRTFLKLFPSVATIVALPISAFSLEITNAVPDMPVELGHIRVIGEYDPGNDTYVLRLDAFNKKTREQICVDFCIREKEVTGNPEQRLKAAYLEALKPAREILVEEMVERKWAASDIVPLPIPHGYVVPEWMA